MLQRVGTFVVGWLVVAVMSVSVTLIAHALMFSWLLPFWLKCFQSCQSFDPPTLDHSFTMQVVDRTSKVEQNLNIRVQCK